MHDNWDSYCERAAESRVGTCTHCGENVFRVVKKGWRQHGSTFAEPDEVTLMCHNCGELDDDEIEEG